MNDGKIRLVKDMIKGYDLFRQPEEVNETISELFAEELVSEKKLACLTERENSIVCDYLGLNDSSKPFSFAELAQKYNSNELKIKANIRHAICSIRFRIRYIETLSQSDPTIYIASLYNAIKGISNKTLEHLHRYNIYKVSDFMSVDEKTIKKMKGLGSKSCSEIWIAQIIIDEDPKKELPIVEEPVIEETKKEEPVIEETKESTPTPRELKLNKLVLLMKQKQLLQEQLNSLDNEINILLNSINIDGDFGHGIK